MVTEEVAEFIPAEDEGVDPVDTTEVDGFDTLPQRASRRNLSA
jgi:hypothetical protein